MMLNMKYLNNSAICFHVCVCVCLCVCAMYILHSGKFSQGKTFVNGSISQILRIIFSCTLNFRHFLYLDNEGKVGFMCIV